MATRATSACPFLDTHLHPEANTPARGAVSRERSGLSPERRHASLAASGSVMSMASPASTIWMATKDRTRAVPMTSAERQTKLFVSR